MEIRVYSPDMDLVGLCENQTSLQWRRKYSECGDFELHVPITIENINLFKLERLVFKRGSADAGVIEDVRYYDNFGREEIVVKGRFLPSYMDRRLIIGTTDFNGKTEEAMRQLFSEATAIPRVSLGELNGYSDTVDFQVTYKNLLEYEQKLALSAAMGFRWRPNFTDKTITFEIYKGVNRTRSQIDNSFVEFSERFNNLVSFESHENSQNYKNVAFIGGEGEGSARVYTSTGDVSSAGLARREVFVDARNIRKENLSTADYENKLKRQGNATLEKDVLSVAYTVVVNPEGNFKYLEDYDIGDVVTVRKESWNIEGEYRITEATEIYEAEVAQIELVIGSPLPERIDWSELNGG